MDLRSDTITKPTLGMKQAMMDALLGDDVYREDPTVKGDDRFTFFEYLSVLDILLVWI